MGTRFGRWSATPQCLGSPKSAAPVSGPEDFKLEPVFQVQEHSLQSDVRLIWNPTRIRHRVYAATLTVAAWKAFDRERYQRSNMVCDARSGKIRVKRARSWHGWREREQRKNRCLIKLLDEEFGEKCAHRKASLWLKNTFLAEKIREILSIFRLVRLGFHHLQEENGEDSSKEGTHNVCELIAIVRSTMHSSLIDFDRLR